MCVTHDTTVVCLGHDYGAQIPLVWFDFRDCFQLDWLSTKTIGHILSYYIALAWSELRRDGAIRFPYVFARK